MTKDEYINRLNNLKNLFPDILDGAEIAALKLLLANMKIRIFGQGKDSESTTLGEYSKAWKKKRQQNGRQIEYKDLSYSNQLFNSIVIGVQNNKMCIGIVKQKYGANKFYPYHSGLKNKGLPKLGLKAGQSLKHNFKSSYAIKNYPDTVQVSEYLEEQNANIAIFAPTEYELTETKKEYLKYLNKHVFKILNGK